MFVRVGAGAHFLLVDYGLDEDICWCCSMNVQLVKLQVGFGSHEGGLKCPLMNISIDAS